MRETSAAGGYGSAIDSFPDAGDIVDDPKKLGRQLGAVALACSLEGINNWKSGMGRSAGMNIR